MASFFTDAAEFYQGFGQTRALGRSYSAVSAFRAAPSVQTAWTLGGNIVGVIGTERVIGQLVKYAVKLAFKARGADQREGQEMVQLMRSRVPVDTGRLLNGITYEDDGEHITVSATAVRGEYDYARFVEFGTKAGQVADEAFFADGADAAAPLKERHGGHGATPAEPFFWNSVHEELAKYHQNLSDIIDQTSAEEWQ